MTLNAILATCVCIFLLLVQVAYQVLLQKHRVNNVAEFLLRWERRRARMEAACPVCEETGPRGNPCLCGLARFGGTVRVGGRDYNAEQMDDIAAQMLAQTEASK